ncbi:transposase [Microbacterium luteum]|uniref:transposase n=1 Tax=unclassified Microbacterium TaxID=2609290 RepID=UPI00188919F2|nr:transposase [Microbacterium luteum]
MGCSASSRRTSRETTQASPDISGNEHSGTALGEKIRNGNRTKTVLTAIGLFEIEVPRDRGGSSEPVIVPKRKRRRSRPDRGCR